MKTIVGPRLAIIENLITAHLDRIMSLGVLGAAASVRLIGQSDDSKTAITEGPNISVARGHRALDRREPINVTDLFQIGSQTKMFVALALVLLQKRGKLDLSDDVTKYVPEAKELVSTFGATLTDLLQHTSGIGNYTVYLEGLEQLEYVPWPTPHYALSDIIALAKTHGRQFPSGERMEYCNTGFILLGEVIRRVTGQEPADFIHSEILSPLGMTDTFGGPRKDWPMSRLTRGYLQEFSQDGAVWDSNDTLDFSWAGTAGDMVSTMPDLHKLLLSLCRDDNPTGLTFADIDVNRVACWEMDKAKGVTPDLMHGPEWGLGFLRQGFAGREQWGHRGGTFGYRSASLCDPAAGLSVSLFVTNTQKPQDFAMSTILRQETDLLVAAIFISSYNALEM